LPRRRCPVQSDAVQCGAPGNSPSFCWLLAPNTVATFRHPWWVEARHSIAAACITAGTVFHTELPPTQCSTCIRSMPPPDPVHRGHDDALLPPTEAQVEPLLHPNRHPPFFFGLEPGGQPGNRGLKSSSPSPTLACTPPGSQLPSAGCTLPTGQSGSATLLPVASVSLELMPHDPLVSATLAAAADVAAIAVCSVLWLLIPSSTHRQRPCSHILAGFVRVTARRWQRPMPVSCLAGWRPWRVINPRM
jgi:hypothetical protein